MIFSCSGPASPFSGEATNWKFFTEAIVTRPWKFKHQHWSCSCHRGALFLSTRTPSFSWRSWWLIVCVIRFWPGKSQWWKKVYTIWREFSLYWSHPSWLNSRGRNSIHYTMHSPWTPASNIITNHISLSTVIHDKPKTETRQKQISAYLAHLAHSTATHTMRIILLLKGFIYSLMLSSLLIIQLDNKSVSGGCVSRLLIHTLNPRHLTHMRCEPQGSCRQEL